MSYEIVTGQFCSSWFGTYEIAGSKGAVYCVDIYGAEQAPHCTCPAYKFSKDRTCKHIDQVMKRACLWNCQWHDGNKDHDLTPKYVNERTLHDTCPNCAQPTVPVRIAV